MKTKAFLISIDTEGDNLWDWDGFSPITTENSRFLSRFQSLCNEYGFRPTYLTNYEMAMDSEYVEFAKREQRLGNCEIGMHLHAWNTPPIFGLTKRDDTVPGKPYLIEYPNEIVEEKIANTTYLLEQKFEVPIITHRAGRWATNELYFSLLNKYGYLSDCSVTPLISWNNNCGYTQGSFGTDYSNFPDTPYIISGTSMVEIPLTVIRDHRKIADTNNSIKRRIKLYKRAKMGYGHLWLRPDGNNLDDLLYVSQRIIKDPQNDYLMFMLHSSELMPGGSPTFDTYEKVEILYNDLQVLFRYLSKHYKGMTIGDYSKRYMERKARI